MAVPHGLEDLFSTALGRFFGWDVIIAVVVLFVAAGDDPHLSGAERWLVRIGALGGAAVGLPLYLWLRLRHQRRAVADV